MKIIPAVDLLDGKVVRLVKGDPGKKIVYSDDPVQTAKTWERMGADALHVVDLDATLGRGSNAKILERIGREASIPVHAAGGIRSPDLARKLLRGSNAVERIVVGTMAYRSPEDVEALAKEFGSDRIVVAIDQMGGRVMIEGWRSSSGTDVISAIENFEAMKITHFLLTSIERDGTLLGPDLAILKKACGAGKVNIIASGGISRSDDVARVKQTGAYAVILGKALYDGKITIGSAREAAT